MRVYRQSCTMLAALALALALALAPVLVPVLENGVLHREWIAADVAQSWTNSP